MYMVGRGDNVVVLVLVLVLALVLVVGLFACLFQGWNPGCQTSSRRLLRYSMCRKPMSVVHFHAHVHVYEHACMSERCGMRFRFSGGGEGRFLLQLYLLGFVLFSCSTSS